MKKFIPLLLLTSCGIFRSSPDINELYPSQPISAEFCNCIQEGIGPIDVHAAGAIHFYATHLDTDLDIDEYSDSLREILPPVDFARYEASIGHLTEVFDDEEVFDFCAESLIENYPGIDTLDDERIIKILTDTTGNSHCGLTRDILTILAD
ncbi:MAG: hypothetical protein EP346_06360 [Bacteroidetes bacterium]|nr:MAG: hypothetical protein EP346_06360 [Bacteroidota bacterium]